MVHFLKSCFPKLLTKTFQLVWIFFSLPKPLIGFKLISFFPPTKAKVCRRSHARSQSEWGPYEDLQQPLMPLATSSSLAPVQGMERQVWEQRACGGSSADLGWTWCLFPALCYQQQSRGRHVGMGRRAQPNFSKEFSFGFYFIERWGTLRANSFFQKNTHILKVQCSDQFSKTDYVNLWHFKTH